MPLLAAISFGDPLMLAGLLAALVPVVLHLLNRLKAPVIAFPTLRFLRMTAEKTARRRQIQQYFLLLVRIIVFALIAMAVASPLIRGGSAGLAYGFVGALLLGLFLLVLGGVIGASAADARKQRAAPSRAGIRWALSLAAFLAAILLGGYAAHGLASDRYFSGDRGEFSGRSTALAVIFDNSHSMLATDDGQTHLARAKAQVRQLLSQTLQPAEAVIIPTNPGDLPAAPGLTADMTRLAAYLDGLAPRGTARPMQDRLATALDLLKGSSQPSKILLIVSDFTQYPFSDAAVFAPIKNLPWRKDLQVIFMPIASPDPAAGIADTGIATFAPAAGTQRPAVGAEITFEAQLVNNRGTPDVRDVQLTVDGKPAADAAIPRVTLSPSGPGAPGGAQAGIARFTYRLAQPGPHVFALELRDTQDAMAWNDHRTLVLDVADQVHVLVVGAQPPDARALPPARSAAFYFLAALAPYDAKAGIPWSIKPTYAGIATLPNAAALAGNAAIFLCDVPRISAPQADALSAYAKSGGRIIWVLGPSVDAASYNATLLEPARRLLPASLAQPLTVTKALPLQWVDTQAGIFGDLFDSQDPFHTVLVTGRWALAPPPAGTQTGNVLAKLADDSPLLIQHAPAGTTSGRVYTLLTTPAASWSNLGATVLLVPLAVRMALGDFQELGPTSYNEGEPVTITAPTLRGTPPTLDITTPDRSVINVQPAGGQPRRIFTHTYADGTYHWKTTTGTSAGAFQVNPPGEEADLSPANVPALATEANPPPGAGPATLVANTPDELLGQLQRRSEGASLAPGFIAMVLMLAVVESLLANRRSG